MKKTLKLILLAVLLFAVMIVFTACGSSEENSTDEGTENSSSSTVSEDEENVENEEEDADEEDSSNISNSGNRVLDEADEKKDEITIAVVEEQVNMAMRAVESNYLEDSLVSGEAELFEDYITENLEDELGSDYKVTFTGKISSHSAKNCEIEYEGETYLFSIRTSGKEAIVSYVE